MGADAAVPMLNVPLTDQFKFELAVDMTTDAPLLTLKDPTAVKVMNV